VVVDKIHFINTVALHHHVSEVSALTRPPTDREGCYIMARREA
jgi:hypothetical protein